MLINECGAEDPPIPITPSAAGKLERERQGERKREEKRRDMK